MRYEFLRKDMEKKIDKKKKQEMLKASQPVKGIHTRASDLRNKSVLGNLIKKQFDEVEDLKQKLKIAMLNEKNRIKVS